MKIRIAIFALILLSAAKIHAAPIDNIDSLKKRLSLTVDSLRGPIYTQLAAQFLGYDAITDSVTKAGWQNHSIDYTLKALHYYSKYGDTSGLRVSFNTLSKVYRSQKKFSEAKWFILQSNTLSRYKNDVHNIIFTLIELAGIKEDINDDKLAEGDLNEALKLSQNIHDAAAESRVQLAYAMLYRKTKDPKKVMAAVKRYQVLQDSIRLYYQTQMMATVSAWDTIQIKKKMPGINHKHVSLKSVASL